jgi:hypothetical protein
MQVSVNLCRGRRRNGRDVFRCTSNVAGYASSVIPRYSLFKVLQIEVELMTANIQNRNNDGFCALWSQCDQRRFKYSLNRPG